MNDPIQQLMEVLKEQGVTHELYLELHESVAEFLQDWFNELEKRGLKTGTTLLMAFVLDQHKQIIMEILTGEDE